MPGQYKNKPEPDGLLPFSKGQRVFGFSVKAMLSGLTDGFDGGYKGERRVKLMQECLILPPEE